MSADVAGRIVEVAVRENQPVKAGDLLFRIDPAPYRIAVAQANAAIANAQVNVATLTANYQGTGADIAAARDAIVVGAAGLCAAVGADEARLHDARAARSSPSTRCSRRARASAMRRPPPPRRAPRSATGAAVPGAKSRHRRRAGSARQGRARPVPHRRPRAGRRHDQPGRPPAGRPDDDHRPARGQHRRRAAGRGSRPISRKPTSPRCASASPPRSPSTPIPGLKLKGHVASLGAGTGSEFSVIPAQNATGNWVKVTQRVPVRIAIDEKSPRQLIAGISADVTVDVRR